MFVSTERAMATSAMKRGGARDVANETTRDRTVGRAAAPGLALATDVPSDVLSQAESAPTSASRLCAQVRHASAHTGSTSTTPQTPVHSTENSRTPATARDIHSRSSSFRKVLERPTNSVLP